MKADRDLECDKCRRIIAKGEEYFLAAQAFTNRSDILCRNEIAAKLEILEQESKKDTPDYDEWRPALVWFDRHRFYLQENICRKLNQIKKVLHEKQEKKPGFLYILFNDFKPNPKMDESYFLPN